MPPADNAFPHLTFERVREGRPDFPKTPRSSERQKEILKDKPGHAAQLDASMEKLRSRWHTVRKSRAEDGLPDLPAGQPMVVVVDEGANLEFLRSSFDFEIVAESDDGYVLVLSEDADLVKFGDTLKKFLENKYGGGSAARLYELCEAPESRLERILSPGIYENWNQIKDTQTVVVDVSISCTGTQGIPDFPPQADDETDEHYETRRQSYLERHHEILVAWDDLQLERETGFTKFVGDYGGEVLDVFQDSDHGVFSLPDCFTVRVRISGMCLKDLAENHPQLFEITEVEGVESPLAEASEGGDAGPELTPPNADAPAVCVIDSGMQEDHVYLQPAILASEARCFIPGESETDTADYVSPNGHGTRVAGALLYPDALPLTGEAQQLPCWVHNARVLDRLNQVPESLMPALYMEHVISHYSDAAREKPARIFNHSINSRAPYRGVHMSTWGAAIDKLSYDTDILVIQSAGNVPGNSTNPQNNGIKQHLDAGRSHPDYLLEPSCRLRNPGQSLNALTVGSISPATWQDANYAGIAGDGHPSAFTPAGPGIWKSIKPDVVEVGGDFARSNATPVQIVRRQALSLNLPRSTMHSPGAVAQDAVGTSFSAPKVAHIAAQVAQALPDEPCLLYRALVANSARWPAWAEDHTDKLAMVRLLGYGVPSLDRATQNTEHRITLISSDAQWIPAREAHVYHVPVPEQLRSPEEEFLIRVDVTLSYASKPRRTRRLHRGYLATWLDWQVSRQGETFDSFCSRTFRDGNAAEQDGDEFFRWMLREQSNWGEIQDISRQNGTLQKDWCYIKSHELPPDFCIAVRGHPGWDPSPDSQAKYALVVSFEAVNEDLQIYQHVRAAVEAQVEAVEAQAEIEVRERVQVVAAPEEDAGE